MGKKETPSSQNRDPNSNWLTEEEMHCNTWNFQWKWEFKLNTIRTTARDRHISQPREEGWQGPDSRSKAESCKGLLWPVRYEIIVSKAIWRALGFNATLLPKEGGGKRGDASLLPTGREASQLLWPVHQGAHRHRNVLCSEQCWRPQGVWVQKSCPPTTG